MIEGHRKVVPKLFEGQKKSISTLTVIKSNIIETKSRVPMA